MSIVAAVRDFPDRRIRLEMMLEMMSEQPSGSFQQILYQVRSELALMLDAKEVGTILIHCGREDMAVEVIRKLAAIKIKDSPIKQ